MSNIAPSSPIPSKGQQKPNLTAARQGFERVETADNTSATPRTADDPKGKQLIKDKDKPITDRAIASEVSQKQPAEAAQKVNKDIEKKRKELQERAFTTFNLENWNEAQIDSLADLARKSDKEFVPYYSRNETDSYNKSSSFIRRSFVEGSSEGQFKEIKTIENPFSDDGSLMSHPLVYSVLSYIYDLLPDEMRHGQDCIEVSLIRQCASSMPELNFHRDKRRQVFVLILSCNYKETDGAEMSLRDPNKIPLSEDEIALSKKLGFKISRPDLEDISYHQANMPSVKGNGYLIRENTDTTADKKQFVEHRRGSFSTEVTNPERITLRILIDSKDEPITEAV